MKCTWIFDGIGAVLAIVVVTKLIPVLDKSIEKIPNTYGLFLTRMLMVFLVFGIAISTTAVKRQTNRRLGIEASNDFDRYLDKEYPDETLNEIYVNMRIPKNNVKDKKQNLLQKTEQVLFLL